MAGTMVIMGEDIMDITMGAVTRADYPHHKTGGPDEHHKLCLTIACHNHFHGKWLSCTVHIILSGKCAQVYTTL